MEVSVEISMYPLGREYVPDISNFIDRLRAHAGITCQVNNMSTQVFGEYRKVMEAITREMDASFTQDEKSVFVMKVINANLQQ